MLIKRARIQNFRCLQEADIRFDSVTTFIGPNGVGKSTVLRALDWFFNGGPLTDDDVQHGASQRRIRVEVEFSCLTAADREALGKYAPESRDTVTIWRTWDDGNDKTTGKALSFGPFEEIRSSAEGAIAKRAKYNELRTRRPELDLQPPAANNWPAVETAMSNWEREHPDQLTESEGSDTHFFGFAGQAIMSGLFDYVLVTADLRASEEAQDARSSVLSRILERSIDRTSADTKLQELSARFLQEQGTIHDEHFRPQLEQVSRELSDAVGTFTRGRSVKVSTMNTSLRPQRVQFAVTILDQLVETQVDRQGHGFQRALLLATLKYLAAHGAADAQEGVICLAIEEPELFQHPTQSRVFASVLRKLADDSGQQIQVAYATHSPSFIEATHFPQVRRVSRSARVNGSTPVIKISHVTVEQVISHLNGYVKEATIRGRLDPSCLGTLREVLFAEAAVLVEGYSDQGVIEGYAEREGVLLSHEGIMVAEAGGKDNMMLSHGILTLTGIPCYLIFDGDQGAGDPAAQGEKNRKILRYLGAAEENFPATGAHPNYAVFEKCLETELREAWPGWEAQRQELISSGTGFLGKNAATYRQATLTTTAKAPDIMREILAAVREMCSSAQTGAFEEVD
jgi:putative ATP-dependent endonuclease of OLD family